MPRKKLFDPYELERAILLRLYQNYSYYDLVQSGQLKLSRRSFLEYVAKYQKWGIESLLPQKTNHPYSSEFKYHVVQAVLNHKITASQALADYKISSRSTLRSWIKKYTEGKSLTPTGDIRRST